MPAIALTKINILLLLLGQAMSGSALRPMNCGEFDSKSGERFDRFRYVQGYQGKRGPIGPKGDMGPMGPPAILNLGAIRAMIDEKMDPIIGELRDAIKELTGRIDRICEQCKKPEFPEGLCEVIYNGKCFWMVYDGFGIKFEKAKEICAKQKNGVPADIFDEVHYNKVVELVRSRIPSFLTFHTLWLGMKFNPKARTTTFSDGSKSTFQKWYPGTPQYSPDNVQMIIWVDISPSSKYQGMWNYFPSSIHHGVLCQI